MTSLFLREIGLIFWGILVGVVIIGCILLVKKAVKSSKDLKKKNIYMMSMALFFLLIAIGLIIRIYFMFFIAENEGEFISQITATERSVTALPNYAIDGRLEQLQFLWQIHVFFTTAGIGFLMFGTEYQIFKKTKYTLTIIEFIVAPLVILLPYEIAHLIYYISFFPPIIWIVIYLIVAKDAVGSVRKNAVMVLIGFIIFFFGVALNSGTVRSLFFGATELHVPLSVVPFSSWISPMILAIGFSIMTLAILSKF